MAFAPAFRGLLAQRLPARPCFGGDLVPLAADLVVGGPFAAPDTAELVVDLAAGRRRADETTMAMKIAEIIAKTAPMTP